MMKRVLALLLALALLAVSALSLAESAETAETEVEAAEELPKEEPTLLVTVNGTEINTDNYDLNYWIEYYLYMLSSSGYDTSSEALLAEVNAYSLENAVNFVILRQKAQEMGIGQMSEEERAQTEAEARASWEDILKSYETNYYGITDESSEDDRATARAGALSQLEVQGYTEEIYVQDSLVNAETNRVITDVRDEVTRDITVSDEDVQAHFDDLVREDQETFSNDIAQYEFQTRYYGQDTYYRPDGYRGVTHILLAVDEELLNAWKDLTARLEEQQESETTETTDADAESAEAEQTEGEESAEPTETPEPTPEPVTPEMVEAARQAILDSVQATVDEIMAKYASGTSFDDLIQEYGTDPGMQDEATRAEGYAIHPDSILYDADFVKGAIALENVGDVSEPIVSQFGVHILQYLRDIPGGAVELTDTLKEQIRETVLNELQQERFNSVLEQWVAESDLVYTEEGETWKIEPPTEDTEIEVPAE